MGNIGLDSFRNIMGRYNLGEVTVKNDGTLDLYNHHQKLTILNGRNISDATRLEARETFARALETNLRARYCNNGQLSAAHLDFMRYVYSELGLEVGRDGDRDMYSDAAGRAGTPLERRTISRILTRLDEEFAGVKVDTSDVNRPTRRLEECIDQIFTLDEALDKTDRTPGFKFMKEAFSLRGETPPDDRFFANQLNNYRGRIVAYAKQVLQGLLATEKDRRSYQGDGEYTKMMKERPMSMIAYALLFGYDRIMHPPKVNNRKPIQDDNGSTIGYNIAPGTNVAGRYDIVVKGSGFSRKENIVLSVDFPKSFGNIRHSAARPMVRDVWEKDFDKKYQELSPAAEENG